MFQKFKKTKGSFKSTKQIKPNITKHPYATHLLIVESPSKCTKIEQYLGQTYQCIATKGHIRELDGLNSIDIKKGFEITFQIIKEKEDHIKWMKSIIDQFPKNNIILASDDDREGEAIAYHICEVFELPIETTKRILFREITQSALLNSLKMPILVNMDLVRAQKTRQIIDVLIGYKVSPLLWKYIYHAKSNSLSAGRGQTPALRLIYENEMTWANAVPTKTEYKITMDIFPQNIKFVLNQEFSEKSDVLKFLEKSKEFPHQLYLGEKQLSKSSSPKPLNTSALLQEASNILHYSPKQTMQLAQQLYQGGYITYMRTENMKYSQEFLGKMRDFIISEYGSEKYVGDLSTLGIFERLPDLGKTETLGKTEILENPPDLGKTDELPHEAIRITSLAQSDKEITDPSAASLYRLIRKHTIESCMSDATSNHYKISITAPYLETNIINTFRVLEYNYILEVPVFLGWKRCVKDVGKLNDNQTISTGLLFHFQTIAKSNNPICPNYIESQTTVHTKHNYYTEPSLIQKLEQLGIGRPSTYATLVDTIQERGYVKCKDLEGTTLQCSEYKLIDNIIHEMHIERTFGKEKNKLIIQPTGILCIEFLIKHFNPLFSYDYTKNMEMDLDKISTIETSIQLCTKWLNEITELIKPVAKIEKQQYKIDDNHFLVFNQYGASIKQTIDKITEYLPVKKSIAIDLDKLKRGEYTLDDLLEFEKSNLGKYENHDLFLRIGKYGNYVEWNENKQNINDIGIPLKEITIEIISQFLENQKNVDINENTSQTTDQDTQYSWKDHPTNKIILRHLNGDFSVRKGKYGNYVYHKTSKMKTPNFYNIKEFSKLPEKYDILMCEPQIVIEWIKKIYNVII